MKNKTKKIISIALASFGTLLITSCNGKVTLDFNVNTNDTATLGQMYEIEEVIAKDSKGKEYLPKLSVKCNGEDVAVTNNKFKIAKLDDYVVSYTVEFNKENVTKETVIDVIDDLGPNIEVKEYKKSILLNETFTFPEIIAVDNSGLEVKKDIKVYHNDKEVELLEDKSGFVATLSGYYTILITATDSSNNETTEKLTIVVRKANEVENFDFEDFVTGVGNIGTPNGAEIAYNSDKNFIIQGNGSMKFISPESQDKGSVPEFTLNAPAITDISDKYSLSFYIYNNNSVDSRVNISNRNEGWFNLKARQWTKIEITRDMYDSVLPGVDFSGTDTGGAKDLTGLRIYFDKTISGEMSYYIDNIQVNDKASDKLFDELDLIDVVRVGVSVTVENYPNIENLNVNIINKSTGEKTLITNDNKTQIFSQVGEYYVEYLKTNLDDKIHVYYDDFVVIDNVKKPINVIENFENAAHYVFGGSSNVELSTNEDASFILDGTKSLKAKINVNDGYPFINTDKKMYEQYFDKFDTISFNIFLEGSKNHNLNINNVEFTPLKPGHNKITMTNEEFKKVVNNDVEANRIDPNVYQLGKLTFFIFNTDVQNEEFNVYYDSFAGEFNSLEGMTNEEINLNQIYSEYNIVSSKVTLNNEEIALVDNKFIPTKVGEYLVTLTLRKEGFEDTEITVKLNVKDSSIPVIEVEPHNNNIILNEEFTLPKITVFDNEEGIVPSIKVLYNGEVIDLVNNKFTPTKYGKYVVIIDAIDSDGNKAETIILEFFTREANEIENFEHAAIDSNFSSFQGDLSLSPNIVKDGKQSLLLTANNGYPELHINKSFLLNTLGNDKYLELPLYINGKKPHQVLVKFTENNKLEYTVESGNWFVIKLTKNHLLGECDDIIKIQIQNPEYFDGEKLETYFDSFIKHSNEDPNKDIYCFEEMATIEGIVSNMGTLAVEKYAGLVHSGQASMKFVTDVNDGYPTIIMDVDYILSRLGKHELFEFYVYMNSSKAHQFLIKFGGKDYGNATEYKQNKTWNRVVISKATLENFKGQKLEFMIFNPGGTDCREDWFEVFFDSFRGTSLEVSKDTIYDFESELDRTLFPEITTEGNTTVNTDARFVLDGTKSYQLNGTGGYPHMDINLEKLVSIIGDKKYITLSFYIDSLASHNMEIKFDNTGFDAYYGLGANKWREIILSKEVLTSKLAEGTKTISLVFVNSDGANLLSSHFRVFFDSLKAVDAVNNDIYDFETMTQVEGITCNKGTLSIEKFSPLVKDGLKGMKFKTDDNDGYPVISMNVDYILEKLGDNNFFELSFYLNGNNAHNVLVKLNNKDHNLLVNQQNRIWNTIKISKEDLIANKGSNLEIMFNNAAGEPSRETSLEIFLDSFKGTI